MKRERPFPADEGETRRRKGAARPGAAAATLGADTAAPRVKPESTSEDVNPPELQPQLDGSSVPGRRSRRLARRPTVSYAEAADGAVPEAEGEADSPGSDASESEASTGPKAGRSGGAKVSGRSCKELRARVGHLLGTFLGGHVPPAGTQVKGGVMAAAAGAMPRFNRMSGIQEWRNCVFLFVNVGGNEYDNVFLSEGRRMTWYAQRTQSSATPVIQRLLRCTSDAYKAKGDCAKASVEAGHEARGGASVGAASVESVSSKDGSPVLLFCRLHKEPYVFCGRLEYESHDAAQSPMRFTWRLRDRDTCWASKAFRAIIHGGYE